MGALTFTPDSRPGVDVAYLDGVAFGTIRRCTCNGRCGWTATALDGDTGRRYRGRPARIAAPTRDQAARALADYAA